jgi:hypothetical protein
MEKLAGTNTIRAEHSEPNIMVEDMFKEVLQAFCAFAIAISVITCTSEAVAAENPSSYVPFVGCKSDGQSGPLSSPKSSPEPIALSSELADQLAYYKAENGFGVLALRGWYCFSTYGSNGSNLFVSPVPINSRELFASDWKGFSGPAIQVSISTGDTSGRFAVAKAVARVFPDRMDFVRDVIAEGIEPRGSFPTGPYPMDKLQRRGMDIVEFETPANTQGLGTQSQLLANSSPIHGLAILVGEELSLVQLSMRLPSRSTRAERTIVERLENEARRSQTEKR